MAYDAIVVGAGHNGLIAAGYLARAGRRVLVLEAREVVGGACVTEEVWPGYRVSVAAYLCSLLRPEIVRDLALERHGFRIRRRPVTGFAPVAGARAAFFHADAERTRAELARLCADHPDDLAALPRFYADIDAAAEAVEEWLLREPPDAEALRATFARRGIGHLAAPFLEGSARALIERHVTTPVLQAILATDGIIGAYGGPSTPGTAYLLLHHCLGTIIGSRGEWGFVEGGMGAITQALAAAVREHGGTIRTGATVRRLLVEGAGAARQVRGVELDSGEQLAADTVLSNADPHRTFARLLGDTGEDVPGRRLATHGGASCKINLAVSALPRFSCLEGRTDLATLDFGGTIHLTPDLDHLERAWDECRQGRPSTEPFVEMYLQTAGDTAAAPPGHHIVSLFTQYFPYHLAPGLDLAAERDAYAARCIGIVARVAPSFPGTIVHRQVLTPRDLEARFGLTGGHIFHGDLLPPTLWRDRPAPGFRGARTPVDGLYLCGSGAHPGGCVFGAPGYLAAQAVLGAG